jgi:hypothetical protein
MEIHMNWNEIFRYEDGNLYWLKPSGRRQLYKPAGTPSGNGYLMLRFDCKRPLVHRVVWEMHNGQIPDGLEIDHIDRNPLNNRIENLRLATSQENKRNRYSRGFSWHKATQKWRAQIYINSKQKYLSLYDNIIDARAAYLRARREYFGEFA